MLPTSLVSSLWFSCGVAVSMGEAANLSFSRVSKQVVMSFCVAGMALCDIPTCLITRRQCQNWRKSCTKGSFCSAHVSRLESLVFLWRRRVYGGKLQNLSFSKVSKQVVMSFCVAGVALCDIPTCFIPCHKFFCKAGATMRSTRFTLYTLHSTLYTLHSTLYTPHSTTLYTLHTPHSTLYTLHSTLLTLYSTLHTFHSPFTLYTLHSTLHNLHFRLLTPHSTLYTPHFTLCTPHFTLLHTPHSTPHTPPHSTTLHHTLHFTLHTPHFTLHTPQATLSTPHSTLHNLQFRLGTPQFIL